MAQACLALRVRALEDIHEFLQVLPGIDRARWVIGRVDDNRRGTVGDGGGDRLGVDLERFLIG